MNGVLSIEEAKQLVRTKSPAEYAGTVFLTERKWGDGVRAVLLEKRSERGQVLALLDCAVDGCTEKHERQIGDVHYGNRCRTHSATRASRTGQSRLRRILPNDTAEQIAIKEAINAKLIAERERRGRGEAAHKDNAPLRRGQGTRGGGHRGPPLEGGCLMKRDNLVKLPRSAYLSYKDRLEDLAWKIIHAEEVGTISPDEAETREECRVAIYNRLSDVMTRKSYDLFVQALRRLESELSEEGQR